MWEFLGTEEAGPIARQICLLIGAEWWSQDDPILTPQLAHVALLGKMIFVYVTKDHEVRSSWMTWLGPKLNGKFLVRPREGRGYVKQRQRLESCSHGLRKSCSHQTLEEAGMLFP
jgi:hypothetical protein